MPEIEQQIIDNLKSCEGNLKEIIKLLNEEREIVDKQLQLAKARCDNE